MEVTVRRAELTGDAQRRAACAQRVRGTPRATQHQNAHAARWGVTIPIAARGGHSGAARWSLAGGARELAPPKVGEVVNLSGHIG